MPREVAGATLLLLGAGSIGREVIPRAKAFDMKIAVLRENVQHGAEGADAVYPISELDRLLPQADFVLISLPTLASTRGMFNRERLARMKSDAYLINVSRGALIDEAALIDRLRTGRLRGAALDVFDEEPLPAGHPLAALDNVILTPHSVGRTDERFANGARTAADTVLAVARGARPPFLVNPEALEHPRLKATLREHRRRSRAAETPSVA